MQRHKAFAAVNALITRFWSTMTIFRATDLFPPRLNDANAANAMKANTTVQGARCNE